MTDDRLTTLYRRAGADAAKFAAVLEELGNAAPDDLFLLQAAIRGWSAQDGDRPG
jgi:hypothetical protein